MPDPCTLEDIVENTCSREYLILSSFCDAEGKLGISSIFDIYMDMASIHAEQLGVGYYDMLAYRCFWVAVRTRVRFYERPCLGADMNAVTWPGKAGLAKMDRYYQLWQGDKLLSEGRTEWGVQDFDTGGVRRTKSYPYPMELIPREDRVCAEPFSLFRDTDLGEEPPICSYTVGSMDIDMGRHMNNVAYIRMLLGTFSTAEQAEMDISEIEILYRHACFEGEVLSIYRCRSGCAWRFRVTRPNGETAAHALIRVRR